LPASQLAEVFRRSWSIANTSSSQTVTLMEVTISHSHWCPSATEIESISSFMHSSQLVPKKLSAHDRASRPGPRSNLSVQNPFPVRYQVFVILKF
jgi:hypothetical protein